MQAALTPVARAGRAPNNPVSFLHTVKAPVFISRLPGNRDANSNKFTDHFLLGLHWPHLSLSFLILLFFILFLPRTPLGRMRLLIETKVQLE